MVARARRRFPDGAHEVGDLRRLMRRRRRRAGRPSLAVPRSSTSRPSDLPDALVSLARPIAPGGWLVLALHASLPAAQRDAWFDVPVDLDFAHHEREHVVASVEAAGLTDVEWNLRRLPPGARPATGSAWWPASVESRLPSVQSRLPAVPVARTLDSTDGTLDSTDGTLDSTVRPGAVRPRASRSSHRTARPDGHSAGAGAGRRGNRDTGVDPVAAGVGGETTGWSAKPLGTTTCVVVPPGRAVAQLVAAGAGLLGDRPAAEDQQGVARPLHARVDVAGGVGEQKQ